MEGIISEFKGIDFLELNGNYLFIVDDDEWDLKSLKDWTVNIGEQLPNIKYAVILKSMISDIKKFSDDEFAILEKILKSK